MPARRNGAIDVLIHGTGPVGCALAAALRGSGLEVALHGERGTRHGFRPIALSYASRLILERLGVWPRLATTPIESILVSQQGGFGRVRIEAGDAGVPALGYVTDYACLLAALHADIEALCIESPAPARCIVHAEGTAQDADEKRYPQDAVVAQIDVDPVSSHIAFERFTREGPLALLPHSRGYALIWSCQPANARALAALDERSFLDALARAAGTRPGRPVRAGARAVLPLVLRARAARVNGREVYVGNAAQTLHPVAGQGLNLGLRDAWDLAETLRGAEDPGEARLLARYAARRRLDTQATIGVTDVLAGAFLGANPLARAARGAALAALDVLPGPRRFFTRRMIFGPSALP